MRTHVKICLAIACSCLLVFGCASLPKTSQQTVIRIANEAVRKAGFQLEYYNAPKAHCFEGIGNKWGVSYDTKKTVPEGLLPLPPIYSFIIFIDDRTGNVDMINNEPPDYSQFQTH